MLHFVVGCYVPDISKHHTDFAFSYCLELYCPIKTQVAMLGEMV